MKDSTAIDRLYGEADAIIMLLASSSETSMQFGRSLLWLTSDARAMCALLPLNGLMPSESDQVRLVARAFYRFATGIEVGAKDGEIPPLLRWSKFAGEELSRIIDKCLSPSRSGDAIATLQGLSDALGRERSNQRSSEGKLSEAVTATRHPLPGTGSIRLPACMLLRSSCIVRSSLPSEIQSPIGGMAFPFRTASCSMAHLAAGRPISRASLLRSWATILWKSSRRSLLERF